MTFPNINHPAGGIPLQPPAGQAEIIRLLGELVAEQRRSNEHLKVLADEIRNRDIGRNALGHAKTVVGENSDG